MRRSDLVEGDPRHHVLLWQARTVALARASAVLRVVDTDEPRANGNLPRRTLLLTHEDVCVRLDSRVTIIKVDCIDFLSAGG
jgi:hypothetical protein